MRERMTEGQRKKEQGRGKIREAEGKSWACLLQRNRKE